MYDLDVTSMFFFKIQMLCFAVPMGKECIRTCVNEEIVDPAVPPGFGSLAPFILKKMDVGVCEPESADMDAKCDIGDKAKVTIW